MLKVVLAGLVVCGFAVACGGPGPTSTVPTAPTEVPTPSAETPTVQPAATSAATEAPPTLQPTTRAGRDSRGATDRGAYRCGNGGAHADL